MAARRDPLADDIAHRISGAEERCPKLLEMTREERAHAIGIRYRQLRKWTAADKPVTPGASGIVTLCRALEVTPEWLLTGVQRPPPGYADWLERSGLAAPVLLRSYMRDLPLGGYDAPAEFYALVERAHRRGDCDLLPPEQIVAAARASLTTLGDKRR